MKPVSKWVAVTREVSCHARLAAAGDTENEDEAAVRRTPHRLVAHQQVAELSAARRVPEEEVLREEFPLAGLDLVRVLLEDGAGDGVSCRAEASEVGRLRTWRWNAVGARAARGGDAGR